MPSRNRASIMLEYLRGEKEYGGHNRKILKRCFIKGSARGFRGFL